jgi:hypothetical protein
MFGPAFVYHEHVGQEITKFPYGQTDVVALNVP